MLRVKNLDLSNSVLRSVSPIHVEYLHNIGVGATLTISLMHNKKLWGLIACHHYSPKNLPHYTRLAAQLQGHFLTSQINVREVAEEFDVSQTIDTSLEKLMSVIPIVSSGQFSNILTPDLLQITNSSGVVFMSEGQIHTYGAVPGEEEIRNLVKWLTNTNEAGFYTSSKLIDEYPKAEKLNDTASGILFHTLGNPLQDCIIWFRPEVQKTVNWAGDPNKAIIKNEKGLSPRKSFELWKERTKNQSEDWKEVELIAASKFAHALQKQTYLLYLTKEETKYRELSVKLQKANSELENINWISNHDLKEPLRKIQVFASKILEEDKENLSEFAVGSVQKMNDSASRMQTLLNDLMSYSQLRDTGLAFKEVDLTQILSAVRDELKEEMDETKGSIEFSKLPIVRGISFQLHQLFLNLIRNSLKFSKTDLSPHLKVSVTKEQAGLDLPELENGKTYYKISVSDNGIGFNNDHAQTIFNVFKRLHSAKKYTGTGIGLAICKKIMENHNGLITAKGEVNTGATFDLYFPIV